MTDKPAEDNSIGGHFSDEYLDAIIANREKSATMTDKSQDRLPMDVTMLDNPSASLIDRCSSGVKAQLPEEPVLIAGYLIVANYGVKIHRDIYQTLPSWADLTSKNPKVYPLVLKSDLDALRAAYEAQKEDKPAGSARRFSASEIAELVTKHPGLGNDIFVAQHDYHQAENGRIAATQDYEAQKAEIEGREERIEYWMNDWKRVEAERESAERRVAELEKRLVFHIEHYQQSEQIRDKHESRIAELEAALKKVLVKEWHRGSLMLQIEDKCEIEAVLKGTK